MTSKVGDETIRNVNLVMVADPMLGSVVEQYKVESLVGTGAMGMVYRAVHQVIGKAVALCAERRCELPDLTLADYRALSPAFEADVFAVLTVEKSMAARQAVGAPSPQNVAAQLERWKGLLSS